MRRNSGCTNKGQSDQSGVSRPNNQLYRSASAMRQFYMKLTIIHYQCSTRHLETVETSKVADRKIQQFKIRVSLFTSDSVIGCEKLLRFTIG